MNKYVKAAFYDLYIRMFEMYGPYLNVWMTVAIPITLNRWF